MQMQKECHQHGIEAAGNALRALAVAWQPKALKALGCLLIHETLGTPCFKFPGRDSTVRH